MESTKQSKLTDFFSKNQQEEDLSLSVERMSIEERKEVDYREELKNMDYQFSGREMKLERISDKSAFKYTNEDEYEFLCHNIIKYVQQRMIKEYNMIELMIPENEVGPKSNIFISNNFYDASVKNCLIIIQGTGAVRPGIWSRKAITQHGLKMGSMLPQLEWAAAQKYSVIIFNPNMHEDLEGKPINYCQTMADHCHFVWDQYLVNHPAQKFAIIAHSAGGRCIASLFQVHRMQFVAKVKALTFTDAYYHAMFEDMSIKEKQWAKKVGIHYKKWSKISKPLSAPFKASNGPIIEVSAGTNQHELATGSCHTELMKFIGAQMKL